MQAKITQTARAAIPRIRKILKMESMNIHAQHAAQTRTIPARVASRR